MIKYIYMFLIYELFTIESRFVKCTIQPSFKTFEPRRFVCLTLCTMRIKGILLLGVELQLA